MSIRVTSDYFLYREVTGREWSPLAEGPGQGYVRKPQFYN